MNRIVLIVGASSGIGMYTAKKFVSSGDNVVNFSRRECEIEGVFNIICDISNNESIEEAWKEFCNKFYKLDILIYSAGFSMASSLEFSEENDYRYLFEVNFFGYLNILKKAIPFLRESKGAACAISSTAAIAPIAYDCFYSASKAALNMLTTALQLELKMQKIRALCIMPGGTKTHFTFKRKIYPAEKSGFYAPYLNDAAQSLENIEQNGMCAQKVALTVYKKCVKKTCAHIFASGFSNKMIAFVIKFIPQRLICYASKKTFKTE